MDGEETPPEPQISDPWDVTFAHLERRLNSFRRTMNAGDAPAPAPPEASSASKQAAPRPPETLPPAPVIPPPAIPPPPRTAPPELLAAKIPNQQENARRLASDDKNPMVAYDELRLASVELLHNAALRLLAEMSLASSPQDILQLAAAAVEVSAEQRELVCAIESSGSKEPETLPSKSTESDIADAFDRYFHKERTPDGGPPGVP